MFSMYSAASFSVDWGVKRDRSCRIVWPLKQGSPVSSIKDTRDTMASRYGLRKVPEESQISEKIDGQSSEVSFTAADRKIHRYYRKE